MEKEFKMPQELIESSVLFERFQLKMNEYFDNCLQSGAPTEDTSENFAIDCDALSTTLDRIVGNTLSYFAREEAANG